jgi:hypothetical protein
MKLCLVSIAVSIIGLAHARAWNEQNHYSQWYMKSQRQSLQVDLGYEKYVGENNITTGISSWKGYVSPQPCCTGMIL